MPKLPDTTNNLPEPWYWSDQDLSRQLETEISVDHILNNKEVKTIARRLDNDDIIFQLNEGGYAVVHLTWQKYPHSDNKWPLTKLYTNWNEVYENVILEDSKDFM
jgi:hypothetical protein